MQTHTVAIFENSKVQHVEALVEYERRTDGGPVDRYIIVGTGKTIPEALHDLADQLEDRIEADGFDDGGNGVDDEEPLEVSPTDSKYIIQKPGVDSCCMLYALCNAARYFGKDSPAPGSQEWEELVDLIGCRYGAAIHVKKTAEALGLHLEEVQQEALIAPAILSVWDYPAIGGLHAALLVEKGPNLWTLVNYPTGHGLERVPAESVRLLEDDLPACRHFNVTLA